MAMKTSLMMPRLLHDEAGASAAEFVLILPLMTLLLFGAVDVGGLAWSQMQVGAAARAGATYALTNGFDVDGITDAVTNAVGLTVTAEAPEERFGCPDAATGVTEMDDDTTPCPDGVTMPGNYAIVSASANYSPIFGWPGLTDPVPLSSETKVRIP
jgi:Flp pilus assembly protein TadG